MGTVAAERATPIVPTDDAAVRAAAATWSRGSPRSAAAPATLVTSTVPARPRRPAVTSSSASRATSSATVTISVAMPSARASWAARPKLSRSPV